MAAVKNGREYLSHVTESLKHRIAQLDESIRGRTERNRRYA